MQARGYKLKLHGSSVQTPALASASSPPPRSPALPCLPCSFCAFRSSSPQEPKQPKPRPPSAQPLHALISAFFTDQQFWAIVSVCTDRPKSFQQQQTDGNSENSYSPCAGRCSRHLIYINWSAPSNSWGGCSAYITRQVKGLGTPSLCDAAWTTFMAAPRGHA